MNLKAELTKLIKLDDVGLITKDSADQIKNFIKQDHTISMIPETEYSAIVISIVAVEIDYRFVGVIFNDKKRRFSDGTIINTSPVAKIVTPIDGVQLISTKNTTYLVI